MRQQRRAGEKLFIDYAGPMLELADGSRAQVFVATMGASSHTFACATADQSRRSRLGAMARALTLYGGVPQMFVPDNPRALVGTPAGTSPSCLPARPCSPKVKATAESAVQVVERWLMARLRHAVLLLDAHPVVLRQVLELAQPQRFHQRRHVNAEPSA